MSSKSYIPPHKRRDSQNRPAPPSFNDGYRSSYQRNQNNNRVYGGTNNVASGKVKKFNTSKGFGFITCDDGSGDIFVHYSEIKGQGHKILNENECVQFEIVIQDDGRRKAINVVRSFTASNPNIRDCSSFSDRLYRPRSGFHPQDNNNINNQKSFIHNDGRNNQNESTLPETEIAFDEKIDTINLEELVAQRKKDKQIIIQIISEHTNDMNTATLIYNAGFDDTVLIPNTFERDEFLKYWFVLGKGPLINEYRDYHRADLYPNYLQLIRRAGISSIKGYKPSKNAKLRLECRFIYRHPKEGIRVTFRGNGGRDPTSQYSLLYTEGETICINGALGLSGFSNHSHRLWILQKDGDFEIDKEIQTAPQPKDKEFKMIIIDDGDMLQVQFVHDKMYCMECKTATITNPVGFHRVVLHNRRDPNRVCDITYLQLSVIPSCDQNTKE